MTRDARLYDMLTSLATNEPTACVETFRSMLGERIESTIGSMTAAYSYSGPVTNEPTTTND